MRCSGTTLSGGYPPPGSVQNSFSKQYCNCLLYTSGEIHGFFANEKDNPRCRYSNEKLELLMKKSVQDAIKMTEELEKAYRGEMRLGKIFDQTFSGKEEALSLIHI